MTELTAERVMSIAIAARIPLSRKTAERVVKSMTPVVAQFIHVDISIAFEVQPATYTIVARRGASV